MLWPSLARPGGCPGEAADCASLQNGEVSSRLQQESGGPAPRASLTEEQIVNPGQSFLGKFAGKRRKWAFIGQLSIFISRPRFFLLGKPAPFDRAHQSQPGVCDLAGVLGACAESPGLEGADREPCSTSAKFY